MSCKDLWVAIVAVKGLIKGGRSIAEALAAIDE
jgi:hypothetical protein